MRKAGWSWGMSLGCVFLTATAVAAAPATRTVEPPGIQRDEPEGAVEGEPEVTDDAIVNVVLQLQRVVEETASFGTWRAPAGSVRNAATRVHQDMSGLSKRLEAYATRRGFEVVPVSASPRASRPDQSTTLGQLWYALKVMEVSEFSPVYLTVLRDFMGELMAITHGAGEAAQDPALRAILVDMSSELSFNHDLVNALLLKNPMPAASESTFH